MNTKTLLPFSAAALFALCAGSMVLSADSRADNSGHVAAPAAARIVDLPTVTVTPTAEEMALYRRIIDLPAVTVRPTADDLAQLLATQTTKIVDMPAITVHPTADDLKMLATAGVLVQQLAAR